MSSITLDEFRDRFHGCESLAVVGNSSSVLSYNKGPLIDTHSVVVRFNKAIVKGFEAHVGTKTDILFGHRFLVPDDRSELQARCVVCLLDQMQSDLSQYRRWVGNRPVLFTLMPDPQRHSVGGRTRTMTTGTAALFMLLRVLDIRRLFVTGFTIFGAGPGGSNEYWHETYQNCTSNHDKDHDARMLTSLLDEYSRTRTLETTPEVRKLMSLHGSQLHSPVRTDSPVFRLRSVISWRLAWWLDRAALYLRRLCKE